jgi:hypothetical protein
MTECCGVAVGDDARDQVAEVLDEPDHSGRHDQRDEQHDAPDKQERHESPGSVLESFAQVDVRPAGSRHRGAQFGPDQSVCHGEDRADQPAKHGLRTTHRCHHGRDGDERSDAAHLRHVDRRRLNRPDLAFKIGRRHGRSI